MPWATKTTRPRSRSDWYKSGLEDRIAKQLAELTGTPAVYESFTIGYEKPARMCRYTPDFLLPNGIVIETKGIFDAQDRAKHLLIKELYPELDVRFVFSRANAPIYKGSKTTHAGWCLKYGFLYSEKLIPIAWLKETPNDQG